MLQVCWGAGILCATSNNFKSVVAPLNQAGSDHILTATSAVPEASLPYDFQGHMIEEEDM